MQVKKDELERRIVDVATELFVSTGFDEASVSMVATRAEVGKGTIYTYFDSKEALLFACATGVFEELGAITTNAVSRNDDAQGFIDDLTDYFFGDFVRKLRVITEFHRKEQKIRGRYSSMARPFSDALRAAHDKYLAGGTLRFEELYAIVTSLFMTSYIIHEGMGLAVVKAATRKTLGCLFSDVRS